MVVIPVVAGIGYGATLTSVRIAHPGARGRTVSIGHPAPYPKYTADP